ncbi:MAG: type II toxin-antitoxin system VapC family toxin [Candidatus Nanopelagicaceae bacterium]
MGQQILLDSTVVIAALRETDTHFEEAKEIFMNSSRPILAISAMTLTEALIRPHSLGAIHAARAESKIRDLIGTIYSFEGETASLAAKIRSANKTRISDSIIIATAVLTGSKLVSFDRKMMGTYERIK